MRLLVPLSNSSFFATIIQTTSFGFFPREKSLVYFCLGNDLQLQNNLQTCFQFIKTFLFFITIKLQLNNVEKQTTEMPKVKFCLLRSGEFIPLPPPAHGSRGIDERRAANRVDGLSGHRDPGPTFDGPTGRQTRRLSKEQRKSVLGSLPPHYDRPHVRDFRHFVRAAAVGTSGRPNWPSPRTQAGLEILLRRFRSYCVSRALPRHDPVPSVVRRKPPRHDSLEQLQIQLQSRSAQEEAGTSGHFVVAHESRGLGGRICGQFRWERGHCCQASWSRW